METAKKTKRDTILRIAAKMFAKDGYAGTDVQAIADRAGVGKGTIYRYFDDKKGLFLSVSDMVMRELEAHLRGALGGEAKAIDQIRAAVRRYLGFFQRHPHYIDILMIERATFRNTIRATHFVYRDAKIGELAKLLKAAVSEGSLRRMDTMAVALALDNLCHGTAVSHALGKKGRKLANAADTILDMFLEGYRKR